MSTKNILAVAAIALSLSAGYAFAGEGNGNPFAFQGDHQISSGRAFVVDTGSDAYPQMTGNTAQPSSLAQLAPAFGEAPIQTVSSLPGYVPTQKARSLHAGTAQPAS
jgi:hypothetical protein